MFKNYGDVNFFDGGVLLQPTETEHEYEIMMCDVIYDSDDGNSYLLRTGTINIDEIDKETIHKVCAWADDRGLSIDYTDEEYERLAVDCFNYGCTPYDYEDKVLSKNEVIDFIDHGYIDEIPWDFYEANFYETNRNVVVEIFNNYAGKDRRVFDTLEDALEEFESIAEKGWSVTIIDK